MLVSRDPQGAAARIDSATVRFSPSSPGAPRAPLGPVGHLALLGGLTLESRSAGIHAKVTLTNLQPPPAREGGG
jgi:hypothetical protein